MEAARVYQPSQLMAPSAFVSAMASSLSMSAVVSGEPIAFMMNLISPALIVLSPFLSNTYVGNQSHSYNSCSATHSKIFTRQLAVKVLYPQANITIFGQLCRYLNSHLKGCYQLPLFIFVIFHMISHQLNKFVKLNFSISCKKQWAYYFQTNDSV